MTIDESYRRYQQFEEFCPADFASQASAHCKDSHPLPAKAMALFIYLWCLLGIPIAAIRSDLDTGDTLETDEARSWPARSAGQVKGKFKHWNRNKSRTSGQ